MIAVSKRHNIIARYCQIASLQHCFANGQSIGIHADVERAFVAHADALAATKCDVVGSSSGNDVAQAVLDTNHIVSTHARVRRLGGLRFTAAQVPSSPFIAKDHIAAISHCDRVSTSAANVRVDTR